MFGKKIWIVGSNFGFPYGGAAASRVRHMAIGLAANQAEVRVFHLSCTEDFSKATLNSKVKGEYKQILYEYTTGTQYKAASFFARRYYALKGILVAICRIYSGKKSNELDWIYLYERDAWIIIPVVVLCRWLKIPVLLELNEWLPALKRYSRIQSRLFLSYTLKKVHGIIAISKNLAEKVSVNNINLRKKVPVIVVPILNELNPNSTNDKYEFNSNKYFTGHYVLWCGDLNSYKEATFFLVEVLNKLHENNIDLQLVLVGNVSDENRSKLYEFVEKVGLRQEKVICPGYVSAGKLLKYYGQATALLIPLFLNDKDQARFPTKISEYFASGNPVVATKLGELTNFVEDGNHAFLAKPNDVVDFAYKISQIISEPQIAKQIGKKGLELCKKEFNPVKHGKRIIEFGKEIEKSSHG